MQITLSPEDAAAIGRVIEDYAGERIADGDQLTVALLVGHKLVSTQGPIVITTGIVEHGSSS